MWILGIDTCTETIDVGLLGEEKSSHRRTNAPRQQLTVLMPIIKELLEEQNIGIKDTDAIAVTTGPGSFTGIRLGIATAKTLAQVNEIPLVPVNTLDVLARQVEEDGIIIPSMDARKNEIFYSIYEKKGDEINRLDDYHRLKIDDYIEFINNFNIENREIKNHQSKQLPPLLTGSIYFRYGKRIEEEVTLKIRKTGEEKWTPSGLVIAKMGKEKAEKKETIDYLHLQPNYLRNFVAIKPKPLV